MLRNVFEKLTGRKCGSGKFELKCNLSNTQDLVRTFFGCSSFKANNKQQSGQNNMTIIEIKICCLYKERNANKKTEQHASLMFVYTPKKKKKKKKREKRRVRLFTVGLLRVMMLLIFDNNNDKSCLLF